MSRETNKNRSPIDIGSKSEDFDAGKSNEGLSLAKPDEQLPENSHAPKPETINHKQETENMEVHHHGHVHHQKKWKEYLFQFVMLFLAVFCGFFAEYQLEHKIEKNREYQYMRGYIDDLAIDTVTLSHLLNFVRNVSNGMDSLLKNLYETGGSALPKTQVLYRQNFTYLRIFLINFSDQTATQLRNSGSLRIIRSKETVHAISEYWNHITHIQDLREIMEGRANEIFTVGNHIFNTKYLISSVLDSVTMMRSVIIDPAARLMTLDSNTLINYANFVYRYKSSIENFLTPNLISQRERAINMINVIKKEYHLE